MAHLARSLASLRISGDTLVPQEVSALLASPPTRSQRIGELLPMGTRGRPARTGMWRLEASATEPENLDAQVAQILGRLTPNLETWRALAARFEIDLFCGWFMNESNEGVVISPSTLMSLGERCIELQLDIYARSIP